MHDAFTCFIILTWNFQFLTDPGLQRQILGLTQLWYLDTKWSISAETAVQIRHGEIWICLRIFKVTKISNFKDLEKQRYRSMKSICLYVERLCIESRWVERWTKEAWPSKGIRRVKRKWNKTKLYLASWFIFLLCWQKTICQKMYFISIFLS